MRDKITDLIFLNLPEKVFIRMGSKGSGNWGHRGRKGKRGGSAPGGGKVGPKNFGDAVSQKGIRGVFNKAAKYKKDGGAYTLRDKDGKGWGYVVKNRETGDWEAKVRRVDFEWSEEQRKTLRKSTAEFTENLGKHDSPASALKQVTERFGVQEKITKQTRFRTEKALPSKIDTSDWNGKNYREKFKEATGHKLGDRVDVPQAKTIAASLQGVPQTGKPTTIHTHKNLQEFDDAYFGKKGSGTSDAYAFYQAKKTGGDIHFSPRCSDQIQIGRGKSTIRHEFAHAVDNTLKIGTWNYRSDSKRAQKIFAQAKKTNNVPREYSKKNEREFFADSFDLVADAAVVGGVTEIKFEFPESHQMVSTVLGDRMPEEWK